jgi:ketosteroid isomerase-like protein
MEDIMAGTDSGLGGTSAGRRLIGKTVLWLTGACAATLISLEIARWAQAALRTWLVATMGTVFLSTVVGAQAPVRGDSGSQRTEIVKVADTYRMAILSGDAQRAAAMYADDGAELPPGHPLVRGPAAIEEHLRGLFAAAKVTGFTFSHLDTTVEGNVAYDAGKYEQQLTLLSGQVLADVGKYLVVLKRTPAGWKAAFVMYNGDSSQSPCSARQ